MLLFQHGQLSFYAAYITYCKGCYPVDKHLERLTANDTVFLFATWNRIGYHKQRLEWYGGLHCNVSVPALPGTRAPLPIPAVEQAVCMLMLLTPKPPPNMACNHHTAFVHPQADECVAVPALI